jgi:predicted DNA-binding protein with PD1-like motif
MDLRKAGGKLIVRLDEGDEVVASVKKACKEHHVQYAHFSGIGACRSAEISHFDTLENKYHSRKLAGMLEIVTLTGNVTTVENDPFVHAHIALGMNDFSILGGHLVEAIINPACEIVIDPLPITVGRKLDSKSGLKLQQF